MPQPTPIVHKHVALTATQHTAQLLHTTPTSTAVNLTSLTTPTPVFRTVVKVTSATGTGWGVLLSAYSYDGIIHTESYISDI